MLANTPWLSFDAVQPLQGPFVVSYSAGITSPVVQVTGAVLHDLQIQCFTHQRICRDLDWATATYCMQDSIAGEDCMVPEALVWPWKQTTVSNCDDSKLMAIG